ncbi:aspartyl-tRNA synthetase, partial [Lecanoromycetidae sp. Uapishka_2]
MASGVQKYFQFAKCFRDEDLRSDRQPEFTQLDLENSFATGEDVMHLVEMVMRRVWKEILSLELPETIPRLTYKQAMSDYGSDKPDLRIPIRPFTIVDFLLPADLISMISPLKDPLIEAMVAPLKAVPGDARKFIGAFLDSSENKHFLHNPDGGPGIFIYDSSKPLHGLSAFGFEAVERIEQDLELEDGNLIILQARKRVPFIGGSTHLGSLRTALYSAAVKQSLLIPPDWKKFQPLWITDFPLFSPHESSEPGQGGNAGLASTHHPFTSPKTVEDVDLLLTDPTKAVADHYDLVINGEEIGGGSRRIHHAEMQKFIFRDILKMDEDRIAEFSHLLEALRAGCPPHAGIALGFDRLVAMIVSSKLEKKLSLRDVIAFPKSGKGEDLMVKSPSLMSEEDLETYHLKLRD